MTNAPGTQSAPTDEVHRIIAEWRRERPDLDPSPLRVLSRITRIARDLDGIRKRAFAEHGLETWEFDVLAVLRRSGAPYTLSPGHLSAETGVTSGTMTNRLDRLEERGLVRRHPHPSDGRGVSVELTDAGRESVDSALADLLGIEAATLKGMRAGEQSALAEALVVLSARMRDLDAQPGRARG